MFSWLKQWFIPDVRVDVYLPKQRSIYHYSKDGGKTIVDADPMVIETEIAKVRPQLIVDFKLKRSIHPEFWLGHVNAVSKIRKIFGVKTYEEGGLLDGEVLDLFDHFFNYVESLKKNLPQQPTSAEETSPSTESSLAEQSPTTSSLPSGSSESVPNIGQPSPSIQEQPLPLDSTTPMMNTMSPLQMEQEKLNS